MSQSIWVINGSADSHDRVQRLLRQLESSPAAQPVSAIPTSDCGCKHTGADCDEWIPSASDLFHD